MPYSYVLPLPRRDAKGRRIIIINPEHFDADPGKWNRDVVVKGNYNQTHTHDSTHTHTYTRTHTHTHTHTLSYAIFSDYLSLSPAIFGLCFYYLMDEKDVVNGWVFFQDFSHFSSRIMTFYGLDTMKKAATLWQVSYIDITLIM